MICQSDPPDKEVTVIGSTSGKCGCYVEVEVDVEVEVEVEVEVWM